MATVNIGSLKFNWKGTYSGSTAYAIDDVTEYNGSSYICILASTGNLPTNTTYFQPMATKGTDGTDVGTTLTTQGDILYRDGSGLQRLPKGTAGQVLKMNSGATAPEYGTLSSDYVKIASADITAVSSISFQDIFNNTTYNTYKIFIQQLGMSTAQSNLRFRWLTSGSTEDSTATYWCWLDGAYYYLNNNTSGYNKDTYRDENYGQLAWWGGYTDNDDHAGLNVMELTLLDPYRNKMGSNSWGGSMLINGSYCYEGASNNRYHIVSNGNIFQKNLTTKSGIKFYCTSGTFDAGGVISIYGMKA